MWSKRRPIDETSAALQKAESVEQDSDGAGSSPAILEGASTQRERAAPVVLASAPRVEDKVDARQSAFPSGALELLPGAASNQAAQGSAAQVVRFALTFRRIVSVLIRSVHYKHYRTGQCAIKDARINGKQVPVAVVLWTGHQDGAVSGLRRTCRHRPSILVTLLLPLLIALPPLPGAYRANAQGIFPDRNVAEILSTANVPGEYRLATFFLSAGFSRQLSAANASTRYVLSKFLSHYLSAQIRNISGGTCRAFVLPNPFPYLSTILYANTKLMLPETTELTRYCMSVFLEVLYKLPVDPDTAAEVRDRTIDRMASVFKTGESSTPPTMRPQLSVPIRSLMHSLFLAPESIAQCIAQISENSVREVSVEDFNELFASRRREIGFTIRSNDVEIVAQVRKFEEKAVEREQEAPVTLDTVRPRIFEVPEFKGMMESVIVVRIDDRKAKARWEIPEWDRYCGSSSRTRGVVFAEQPNLKCIFEEGSFGERWLYVFVDEPKMSTLELRELAISISGTDFVRDPAMKWSLDPDLKQIYLFFLGRRALDK